jgi:hypothetical protein
MDIGLNVQTKRGDYPNSFYGLTKDNLDTGTMEFNYQSAAGETLYGYYSVQRGKKGMNMNSGVALVPVVNTCTAANLATYGYSACSDNVAGVGGPRPASGSWFSDQDDRNNMFGLGFQKDFGSFVVGGDYSYSDSVTRFSYQFGGTALNGNAVNQAAIAAVAGSALPNMTFAQQILTLNVLIPIDKKMSLRIFDRFEIGKVKDWHYDGVIKNAVAAYDNGTLLLDSGPQDYRANVIGVFIQYKL